MHPPATRSSPMPCAYDEATEDVQGMIHTTKVIPADFLASDGLYHFTLILEAEGSLDEDGRPTYELIDKCSVELITVSLATPIELVLADEAPVTGFLDQN